MGRLVLPLAILLSTLSGVQRALGDTAPPVNTPLGRSSIAPGTSTESLPPQNWGEWSGYVSFDARLFPESPEFPDQKDQDFSVAFAPEYYADWADGDQEFVFSPFFRYDTADDQRTRADIRELYWRTEHERWVGKIGVDVVFRGCH